MEGEQRKETMISIIMFLVIGILLSGIYLIEARQSVVQNRERYRYIAASQSNLICGRIDTVLSRVFMLSTLVNDNGGDTNFFERQSKRIYQETEKDTGIALKNIAVAPQGIVEKVYPSKGNEALVGFDFMDETKPGNLEAIAAYKRGELIITNPFELIQGGSGFAGRLPVFLENDGHQDFWGLVTVTIDFEELMKTIDLKTLSNMGVDYTFWYQNDDGNKTIMEASSQAPEHPVSYEFTVGNLSWHLDVAPSDGWIDYIELAIVLCVIFVVALLMALLQLNRGQIKKANERLQRLAHLDGLTSCYSRNYVNTILLNQRNGEWNDPNLKYSLAIVDIDNFKSINDTYGHEVGDRAIIAISQTLKDNCKSANGDCVIRHGGDEFIILYNDVTKERFQQKLASIVQEVRNIHFPDLPEMKLSVSIGGEHYSTPDQSLYYNMVRQADKKLYQAKETGRNRYTL